MIPPFANENRETTNFDVMQNLERLESVGMEKHMHHEHE